MSEMSGSCSPNMFKAAQKGHSSPGWLSLVIVPLLAVIMLCATLSLWAFMSWVPKGREGAERMTFPFLGYPGTFRTARTHTSLKSRLPGAEAVAGVSLLPAFWLSPKPSGSPGLHSHGRLSVAVTCVLICTISGSQCLRGETWLL